MRIPPSLALLAGLGAGFQGNLALGVDSVAFDDAMRKAPKQIQPSAEAQARLDLAEQKREHRAAKRREIALRQKDKE